MPVLTIAPTLPSGKSTSQASVGMPALVEDDQVLFDGVQLQVVTVHPGAHAVLNAADTEGLTFW